MRVLVCGGRDYADRANVFSTLDRIACVCDEMPMPDADFVLIHGGATGADAIAHDWAVCSWVETQKFAADWITHGKAAGPIRNQRMLDEGKPDLVVAFSGGRGTADMVRRAKAAGVKVFEVPV
jgi:hypothetical protein